MFGGIITKHDSAGTPYLKIHGKVDLISADGGGLYQDGSLIAGTELGYIDGVTAGTCTASKALVVGTAKECASIGRFTHGAFHSTTHGSGLALSSTYTGTCRVYSDDANTAFGSYTGDLRGFLSRVLITKDHSSGNNRCFGLMGHIKSYDGEWGDEQWGGVHGYLELVQNAGTINFQQYGVSAGVMSTVETAGTMTVDANHTVAGVAAISKLTSGMTQTGKTAGLYVGIYDVTNWSDATARSAWKWGAYVAAGAATNGYYANCSALGATGRVLQLYGTMANGALTDGYGAAEIDLTLSGTNTSHVAASSSWVNITTGTAAAGLYVCAQNNGIYEVTAATVTNAKLIFGMRAQKVVEDTDGLCFPFSINTNNTAITAFVDVNNHTDLGWTTGAGSSGGGKIPFMRDAAGNILYVNTYTG